MHVFAEFLGTSMNSKELRKILGIISITSQKCISILLYRPLLCVGARATAAGAQKLNKDLKNTQQQHSNATRHKIDQRSLSSIYTVVVVQGKFGCKKCLKYIWYWNYLCTLWMMLVYFLLPWTSFLSKAFFFNLPTQIFVSLIIMKKFNINISFWKCSTDVLDFNVIQIIISSFY